MTGKKSNKKMNQKGQISIESLAILGLILIGATIFAVFYLQSTKSQITQVPEIDIFDQFGHNVVSPNVPQVGCGDGNCGSGENCSNCEQDCGECPFGCDGDSVCEPNLGENCSNCSACYCDENHICDTVQGYCVEVPHVVVCTDGICDGDECSSCPGDCSVEECCGNGNCDSYLENTNNCSVDCCPASFCRDGTCGSEENCSNCEDDCGLCSSNTCGNGVCDMNLGETCSTCSIDCGTCSGCTSSFTPNPSGYIEITSCACLQKIGELENLDKNYILKNDIDCSATRNWNDGNGFIPIGYNDGFTGIFDGNNHTIYNLYIGGSSVETSEVAGLFGYVFDASLKNIKLKDVNINEKTDDFLGVGGLVGYVFDSNIYNCSVTGSIQGKNNVGGLIGSAFADLKNINISNSFSSGYVKGTNNVGGLIGSTNAYYGNVNISTSYSDSNVVSNGYYIGGFIGFAEDATNISNCYASGEVYGSEDVGGFAGSISGSSIITNSFSYGKVYYNTYDFSVSDRLHDNGLDDIIFFDYVHNIFGFIGDSNNNAIYCYWDTETSMQSESPNFGAVGLTTSEMKNIDTYLPYWNISTTPCDENIWYLDQGSDYPRLQWELNCEEITNCTDLQNIGRISNLSKNYFLKNNINCSDTVNWNNGKGFNPIGNSLYKFVGSLNGRYHTISNLYINRPCEYNVGLFGYTQNASLSNIKLKDVNVNGKTNVGGLVGYSNSSIISNNMASGNVSGNSNIGGLFGSVVDSNVSQCYSIDNVSGIGNDANYIGGLIGFASNSNISNSYASGNVFGVKYVGGLIGSVVNTAIFNSYSRGLVTGTTNVGGFIGYANTNNANYCYWDKETSMQSISPNFGAIGKTTSEMKNINTYLPYWDISSTLDDLYIWYIYQGNYYPELQWADISHIWVPPTD